MKTINVTFEDEEFLRLLQLKDEKSWREFIVLCAEVYEIRNKR